jgi:transposase
MAIDVGTEVIAAIIAMLAAPLAATVTWRFTKRKTDADTNTSYAQAANVSVETMLAVVNQLRQEVEDLARENAQLRVEIARLAKLVRELGGSL